MHNYGRSGIIAIETNHLLFYLYMFRSGVAGLYRWAGWWWLYWGAWVNSGPSSSQFPTLWLEDCSWSRLVSTWAWPWWRLASVLPHWLCFRLGTLLVSLVYILAARVICLQHFFGNCWSKSCSICKKRVNAWLLKQFPLWLECWKSRSDCETMYMYM